MFSYIIHCNHSDSVASTSSVPPGYVSGLDRTGADTTSGSTANDLVPELVVNDWSDDPEMIAGEIFEAAVELQRHFPDYQIPAKVSIWFLSSSSLGLPRRLDFPHNYRTS